MLEVISMAKHNRKHLKKQVRSIHAEAQISGQQERPISNAYPVIDNDLARDNIENDSPAANLQDI